MTYKTLLLTMILGAALGIASAPAFCWQHQHGTEAERAAAAAASAPSPAELAKLEADKRFSEFNHRFAGLFVLLLGLLALIESRLAVRYAFVRYLWALFFFIPGIYLLFLSDPESWPTGNQTLYYVITENMQVLQHKIFSILLLALSVVEYFRVRHRLRSLWAVALFPALAAAGALLLFVHSPQAHAAGMGAAAHLTMQKVEHQHIGFAVVGLGIALTKAATDWGRFHPRWMRNLFAVLMCTLGVLLLLYTE